MDLGLVGPSNFVGFSLFPKLIKIQFIFIQVPKFLLKLRYIGSNIFFKKK
jgi:hypothetical protein